MNDYLEKLYQEAYSARERVSKITPEQKVDLERRAREALGIITPSRQVSIIEQLENFGRVLDMDGKLLTIDNMFVACRELVSYRYETDSGVTQVRPHDPIVDFHCSKDMFGPMVDEVEKYVQSLGVGWPLMKSAVKDVAGIQYIEFAFNGQRMTICDSDVYGYLNAGTVAAIDMSDIIPADYRNGWTVVSPNHHFVWRNCKSV